MHLYPSVILVQASLVVKEYACQCRRHRRCGFDARDPWSKGSSGEGNDNLPQCSCLENSMDRGAWQAIVQGVAKSRTCLIY